MPQFVLKRSWHTDVFFRTITLDGESVRLAFRKREPTELSDAQLAAVQDAGAAPIEPFRPSAAPRIAAANDAPQVKGAGKPKRR